MGLSAGRFHGTVDEILKKMVEGGAIIQTIVLGSDVILGEDLGLRAKIIGQFSGRRSSVAGIYEEMLEKANFQKLAKVDEKMEKLNIKADLITPLRNSLALLRASLSPELNNEKYNNSEVLINGLYEVGRIDGDYRDQLLKLVKILNTTRHELHSKHGQEEDDVKDSSILQKAKEEWLPQIQYLAAKSNKIRSILKDLRAQFDEAIQKSLDTDKKSIFNVMVELKMENLHESPKKVTVKMEDKTIVSSSEFTQFKKAFQFSGADEDALFLYKYLKTPSFKEFKIKSGIEDEPTALAACLIYEIMLQREIEKSQDRHNFEMVNPFIKLANERLDIIKGCCQKNIRDKFAQIEPLLNKLNSLLEARKELPAITAMEGIAVESSSISSTPRFPK